MTPVLGPGRPPPIVYSGCGYLFYRGGATRFTAQVEVGGWHKVFRQPHALVPVIRSERGNLLNASGLHSWTSDQEQLCVTSMNVDHALALLGHNHPSLLKTARM